MGVRHALFPGPTFGAPLRGCRLPDAILHGKRSLLGLIAGPSSALRTLNYRVRPLSSLRLVVAPPAYEPGGDTLVILSPRLHRLPLGRPPLMAVRWPSARVWPLISQVAFRSQASGVVCNIAEVLEVFHEPCPDAVFFPARMLILFAFRRLSFGWPSCEDRQSHPLRADAQ